MAATFEVAAPPFFWSQRVAAAALLSLASAVYTKHITARLRPGLPRLASALPVVALYWALPLAFDRGSELLTVASLCAMLLWLGTFKLLSFCLNRGPLAAAATAGGLSQAQWAALQLWPVIPVEDEQGRPALLQAGRISKRRGAAAMARLVSRLPENLLVFLLSLAALHARLPRFPKIYAAAFGMSGYCGLWANALAALVMWLHNLDVAPSWDRPWLQSSLADFWGHRWNLPAAASLKTLVYEPIAEGCWVKQQGSSPGAAAVEQNGGLDTAANDDGAAAAAADAAAPAGHGVFAFRRGGRQQKEPAGAEASTETTAPPPVAPQALPKAAAGYDRGRPKRPSALRRAAATCATFLISGLLHEALLWYVTGAAGRPQRYKQLVYFTMQGPMLLVEGALKKAAGKAGVSLPRWASIPLASLTLQLSGYTLFWGAWFDSLNAMDVAAKVKPLAGMA